MNQSTSPTHRESVIVIIQTTALSHSSRPSSRIFGSLRHILPTPGYSNSRNPRLNEDEAEDISARYAVPLYVYARANGCDATLAEHLVQQFLLSLQPPFTAAGGLHGIVLQRLSQLQPGTNPPANADPPRAGLLPATHELEQHFIQLHADETSPLRAFRRSFGYGLIARALQCLQEEARQSGHEALFLSLHTFLTTDPKPCCLARCCEQFGLPRATVIAAIARLRLRLRELVDELLLQTVADTGDLLHERSRLRRLLRESYLPT